MCHLRLGLTEVLTGLLLTLRFGNYKLDFFKVKLPKDSSSKKRAGGITCDGPYRFRSALTA